MLGSNTVCSFTQKALKNLQQAEVVKLRVEQLDNLPERDIMLFNEWQESYNKVSAKIIAEKEEEEKKERKKRKKTKERERFQKSLLSTAEMLNIIKQKTKKLSV